jgi:hypothetical protein
MDDHVAVVRRVVIIDSSRTALAIIEAAFDTIDTFVVIGVARDTASGLDLVRRTIPDAAMIGVDGLEAGGLDLLRSINAWQQTCKIVLSDRAADDIIVASQLEVAGASLCLSRREISVDPRSFFDKVHHACDEMVASTRGRLAPLDISSGDGVRTGTRTPRAPVHFGYPVPLDEDQRCMALERRGLADGIRERQFDLITRYMAEAASFPVCLLTCIDHDTQWIKSSFGYERQSMPRALAFCNYTLAGNGLFVVPNAEKDPRFSANPLVVGEPQIRAYAGYPVILEDGLRIAVLCLLDTKPRQITAAVSRQLIAVADIIGSIIDNRLVIGEA